MFEKLSRSIYISDFMRNIDARTILSNWYCLNLFFNTDLKLTKELKEIIELAN